MTFLRQVIEEKKALVRDLKTARPLRELRKMIDAIEKRPFYDTFGGRSPEVTRIIAEVKKASPSRGLMVPDLDIPRLVAAYEEGGASAVSVITEEKHFQGSLAYVALAKQAASLPILRKDFIVDEYELYQSKAFGADALLLIGEALDPFQISDYLAMTKGIDIDVLMEIHSLKTYEKVAGLKGFILGINNRNLETLKVDLTISDSILGELPKDQPVIIESGIEKRDDIERFMKLGAYGFLIGTSLVLSADPVAKLKELRGEA